MVGTDRRWNAAWLHVSVESDDAVGLLNPEVIPAAGEPPAHVVRMEAAWVFSGALRQQPMTVPGAIA